MFANLVVELKKHHYSQRGLAAYIGISESSMNDKMNGRTQLPCGKQKPFRRYSKAVHWTTCLKKKNEHLCCSTDAQRGNDYFFLLDLDGLVCAKALAATLFTLEP